MLISSVLFWQGCKILKSKDLNLGNTMVHLVGNNGMNCTSGQFWNTTKRSFSWGDLFLFEHRLVTACCLTADMSHTLVNSGLKIKINVSQTKQCEVWSSDVILEEQILTLGLFSEAPISIKWTTVGLILMFLSSYSFEKLLSGKRSNMALSLSGFTKCIPKSEEKDRKKCFKTSCQPKLFCLF